MYLVAFGSVALICAGSGFSSGFVTGTGNSLISAHLFEIFGTVLGWNGSIFNY